MKSHRYLPIAAVFVVGTGCTATFAQRNMGSEPLERQPIALPKRACSVLVERPVDLRPEHERRGGENKHLRLLLPLIPVMWIQSTEFITYQASQSIRGERFVDDLRVGIKATLEAAAFCEVTDEREAAEFVLGTEVHHFYGVSYEEHWIQLSAGGGTLDRASVFPAGQVAVRVVIQDAKTGALVARRWINQSAIFDPRLDGGSTGSVESFKAPNHESNRGVVAVSALRRFYRRLPAVVDREIAAARPPVAEPGLPRTFVITRALATYARVERAIVETATGRVLAAEVVLRRTPVMGRPGRWVLSPHQPGYLPPATYRRLVAQLQRRYDLRFEENLTAARFYGLR
ncbi:MAG: hypothetical protein RMA76_13575 [Deltaproteobacteria bacterium]|jgi:hypothetical protein